MSEDKLVEGARVDPREFWSRKRLDAVLPRILGDPPEWGGSVPVAEALAPVYAEAAERARALLAGTRLRRRAKQPTRALDKKSAFLRAFAILGSITEAAKAVKVDRGAHYDWMRHDAAYPARFAAAKAKAEQKLEAAAVRTALDSR